MRIAIIGIAVVLGLLGIVVASNLSSDGSASEPAFAAIKADLGDGAHLYDVRTADEYAAGHIVGAELHDVQLMQAGTYPDVEKDSQIYVYCRSGNRSAQATSLLKNAGYTEVTDLGAITAVEAMGGTITQ